MHTSALVWMDTIEPNDSTEQRKTTEAIKWRIETIKSQIRQIASIIAN